mmetsp:Transcript_15661/g.44671  ORF Transcript_15661/g.44671 Transcript_15661/m.44671 type:complete len:250 (+) Transcript_15661:20322-21071(+)
MIILESGGRGARARRRGNAYDGGHARILTSPSRLFVPTRLGTWLRASATQRGGYILLLSPTPGVETALWRLGIQISIRLADDHHDDGRFGLAQPARTRTRNELTRSGLAKRIRRIQRPGGPDGNSRHEGEPPQAPTSLPDDRLGLAHRPFGLSRLFQLIHVLGVRVQFAEQLDAFERHKHHDEGEDDDDVVADLQVPRQLSEAVKQHADLVVDIERVESGWGPELALEEDGVGGALDQLGHVIGDERTP